MRLIVTGGLGFIGSNFATMALQGQLGDLEIESLVVLDIVNYAANLDNLKDVINDSRLKIVTTDIVDVQVNDSDILQSDFIIHFAAETHVDNSIRNGKPFLRSNVLGTANLATISRITTKPLLVVSTDEVYGSIKDGFADEDFRFNPSSPYSASKAAAEHLAHAEFLTFGADIRISRCTNNYGKNQYPEKLIPKAIQALKQNKKISIYGDGLQKRDWISVEDHCRALSLIILKGKPGDVYNIGSGIPIPNLEIIDEILRYMGRDHGSIEFVADRLGHDSRYAVNIKKIHSNLGWEPSSNILSEIPRLITLYT